MRLFKVKTWVDLTIETRTIFGQRKCYTCYFTWNTKYIYAENADDAKIKYSDYFFSPAEDGYNKELLSVMEMCYKTKSNNMKFHLAFNEKIVHTHEHVQVVEREVTDTIDTIKRNSTADDFRNWLMNGTAEKYSLSEIDWLNK